MLRETDEVDQPVGDERGRGDDQRQHPQPGTNPHRRQGAVKQELAPRPPRGLARLGGLVGVQRRDPLPNRRLGRAHQPERRQEGDRNRGDQAALAEGAPRPGEQIDGEHLQQEGGADRGPQRQQILAVARGMQGVAVMVGVAGAVVERVPPTQQAVQIQEDAVEPLGTEHGAMRQLVRRHAGKEADDRTVREQRGGEPEPKLPRPAPPRQRPGGQRERQVAAGLQPPLQVAALHETAQRGRLHRRPIPRDPQAAAHLVQRRISGRFPHQPRLPDRGGLFNSVRTHGFTWDKGDHQPGQVAIFLISLKVEWTIRRLHEQSLRSPVRRTMNDQRVVIGIFAGSQIDVTPESKIDVAPVRNVGA